MLGAMSLENKGRLTPNFFFLYEFLSQVRIFRVWKAKKSGGGMLCQKGRLG